MSEPNAHHVRGGVSVRKVVASHFVSFDGVAEQPNEFVSGGDEEVDESGSRLIATMDAVLLGRRTYDEWAGFWPDSDIEPFASFINGVEKYVATSSMPELEWANTTVIEGGVVEFVSALKQRPGGDIGVLGSIALTQSLLEGGLVDELRLCVAPVLHMRGRKLFDRGLPQNLVLTRCVASPSGCLLLDYQIDNGVESEATSS
jgi:dihydrofolate reductase